MLVHTLPANLTPESSPSSEIDSHLSDDNPGHSPFHHNDCLSVWGQTVTALRHYWQIVVIQVEVKSRY
jgi:hypothetical protein